MLLGIDLRFILADGRGMGRLVRNILLHLPKTGADCPRYIFFAKNHDEVAPVKNLLLQLGFCENASHVLPFIELPGSRMDVCWFPWNRIDAVPLSGKCLLQLNDVAPYAFPYKNILRYWDQKKDERRFQQAACRADRIITISEFSKLEIMKYLNVPEDRIHVIYLGVESGFQPPCGPSPFSFPYFLYVGSNDTRKNLPRLIEAFVLFAKSNPGPHRLLCCGTENTEKIVREDIQFFKSVDESTLKLYYQHACAFVFPSLYEGFGLPILEAMASGTPVITSSSSSLPEVAGDAAMYCDAFSAASIAECLGQMVKDSALCDRLTCAGLQRAKEFSWEITAQELVAQCVRLHSESVGLPCRNMI